MNEEAKAEKAKTQYHGFQASEILKNEVMVAHFEHERKMCYNIMEHWDGINERELVIASLKLQALCDLENHLRGLVQNAKEVTEEEKTE